MADSIQGLPPAIPPRGVRGTGEDLVQLAKQIQSPLEAMIDNIYSTLNNPALAIDPQQLSDLAESVKALNSPTLQARNLT